jgi:hypothetical protein
VRKNYRKERKGHNGLKVIDNLFAAAKLAKVNIRLTDKSLCQIFCRRPESMPLVCALLFVVKTI